MVSIKTIASLGIIIAFFAFGGLTLLQKAKDKAGELKTSLDAKINEGIDRNPKGGQRS